jgi:hypothetical protein
MFDLNQEREALEGVLPQDVLDNFNFADQENYQDATGPIPPATGNYELRIEKSAIKKDKKTGKAILDDGKWPTFSIYSATIVDTSNFESENGGGLGAGTFRKIGLLYDVRTKPFERGGKLVSNFVDLLRAYDVSRAGVNNIDEGLEVLTDLINQEKTFRCRLDWYAEDYEARNAELARHGETTAERKAKLSKEAFNNIYKKWRVTTMKAFPRRADGGYDAIWTSPAPSNKPVEARLQIVKFYNSLETVRLGPDGVAAATH